MRELGRKSGAIARLRLAEDPNFFKRLGAKGGRAAAAAIRRRLAETAEADFVDPAISSEPIDSASPTLAASESREPAAAVVATAAPLNTSTNLLAIIDEMERPRPPRRK